MTRRLLVLGAGGHGKVVADAALASGRYGSVAFADDRPGARDRLMGLEIMGAIDDAVATGAFDALIVGIGHNATRLAIQDRFEALGAPFDAVVHPRAVVAPSASIGPGSVLMAGAVVNAEARIERAVIANTTCVVEHDCVVADGAHLSPGALLGGECSIGVCGWIGIGACLIQGRKIGAASIIGAGAVLLSHVGVREVWAGVPARRIRPPPSVPTKPEAR